MIYLFFCMESHRVQVDGVKNIEVMNRMKKIINTVKIRRLLCFGHPKHTISYILQSDDKSTEIEVSVDVA